MNKPLKRITESDYTKIADLTPGKYHNIYCYITEIYDWRQSRGTDLVMTLKVSDNTCKKEIFVKIFSPVKIFEKGFHKNDILKINQIRNYKDNFYLLSMNNDIEVVYSKEEEIDNLEKYDSFVNELKRHIDMVESDSGKIFMDNVTEDSKKHSKKYKQIKDLKDSEYVNFTGLLLSKQVESNNLVVLSLVDNTLNPKIENSVSQGVYSSNMILYVKAWDRMANISADLELHRVYNIENIKILLKDNMITGNLSDKPDSMITLADTQDIKLKMPSIVGVIRFDPKLYATTLYKDVKNLKEEGYFKICVNIVWCSPIKGVNLKICRPCRNIDEVSQFKECCDKLKEEMFFIKFLVQDDSGENILIAKNEVGKALLSRLPDIKSKIELLVFSYKIKDKFSLEIRDIPGILEI